MILSNKMDLTNYLPQKIYTKIRFKISKTNHLIINGRINGINGRFILDTGASNTCIDSKNIDLFQLNTTDTETLASGAGSNNISTQVAYNNNLKLGRWNMQKIDLIVIDLSHVNQALSNYNTEPVNGIIGADVLQYGKGIIDYSNHYLFLTKQKRR